MPTNPLEVPATVATQVNLAITDNGWRISFGEQVNEKDANYHVAVFLPTVTAHQLTDMMAKQKNANSQ